jgi:lipoyl(octanoyl) transferase
MAADRALLEWVSRDSARIVFRTYEWDRPTLSLGRGERFPDGWDVGALERGGIAVVRRPTGGSAVLHAEEVTFAVAASIPGPWRTTPRDFANAVAAALSRALRACGVAGSRVADSAGKASRRGEETVCFARSAPGEVLAGGYKVAGLASRFGRTGALCHASVPLTARSRTIAMFRTGPGDAEALERNARSVGEILGMDLDSGGLADRLALEIESGFGVSLVDAPFAVVGLETEHEEPVGV